MKLAELIYEVRQMRGSADSYKGKAGQAEEARLINVALKMIGRYLRITDPLVTWNLRSGVQTYDYSQDFGKVLLEPYGGIIAGQELTDGDGYWRFCSAREFQEITDWRNATNGQPTAGMVHGNRLISLDKKPTPAVIARGGHYVEAKVLPGAICESGIYLKRGFAESFSEAPENSTAGSSTKAPGTASAIDIGGGVITDVANASNILTDNGVVATYTVPAPAIDPGIDMIAVSNFAFALPAGAVVQDVRIESVEIGSTGQAAVYFRWCASVSDTTPIAEQFIGVEGAMAQRGPLPYQTGINSAHVAGSSFGLQIYAVHQAGDPNFSPMSTPFGPITVTFDSITVSVRYTLDGSGTSGGATLSESVALNCEPDLPEEAHWAIAALAAILAMEPAISQDVALARIGQMESRTAQMLKDMRAENARASSSVNGRRAELFGGFYRSR